MKVRGKNTPAFKSDPERLEADGKIIDGPDAWFARSAWATTNQDPEINERAGNARGYYLDRYRETFDRYAELNAERERRSEPACVPGMLMMAPGNGLDAVARVTIITNHNGLATKVFRLNGAGLEKVSAAQIYEATFQCVEVRGIAGFLGAIKGLSNQQATTYGVPELDAGTIVTQSALNGFDGAIARDRDHFAYAAGRPGVLMLDCDARKDHPARSWEELDAILCKVMPELAEVERAWRPSSSAFIYRASDGEELIGVGGWRCYLMVDDASRIPMVGGLIYQRLWEAGHGYIQLSKSGAMLDRSIIDAAVWQPERLDFAAPPKLGVGLERRPPEDVLLPGEPMLRTEGLPASMPLEEWRRSSLTLQKARDVIKPKAENTRKRFVKERVEELKQKGTKVASSVIERAARDQVLSREFIVTTDTGRSITIGEMLADAGQWDRTRLHDPLEPDYASDPRIAIALLTGGQPRIYSHAHGGMTYRIADVSDKTLNKTAEDTAKVRAAIERLAALPEEEYVLVDEKAEAEKLGINDVRYLKRMVKEARKAKAKKAGLPTDSQGFECIAGIRLVNEFNARRALQLEGVKLRFNEFAYELLIQGLAGYGPRLDDAAASALYMRLWTKYGLKYPDRDLHALLSLFSYEGRFHPAREYFDSLKWDMKPRLGAWMHTYLGAPSTELNAFIGRATLTAAARRVRHPGCKFDYLTILEGPQGIMKSTAIQALCPDVLWFLDGFKLNTPTKEVMELTAGKLLVEISELVGRKMDHNAVKTLLSKQRDKSRLAYGHYSDEWGRQFIFLGTTNDEEYLLDPTGNRRYWPVKCGVTGRIDIEALKRDRDQLWAEAAYWEAKDERIYPPDELIDALENEQAAREETDEWDGFVDAYLEKAFPLPAPDLFKGKRDHIIQGQRVTIATIAENCEELHLAGMKLDPRDAKRIEGALRRAGWAKAERSHGKNYWRRGPKWKPRTA